MGKLIVDQIQKPGGSIFTLPTTASAGGLISDASGNLSIGNFRPIPIEGNTIGMIVTSSAQANVYGSTGQWTSDGPGGQTYQARYVGNTITDTSSTPMAFNMLMGDGMPTGGSDRMFAYNRNGDIYRQCYYANNKRLGHMRQMQYYSDNTTDDYTGITMSVLPLRNTTGSTVTRTLPFYHSSDYSSYGGAAIGLYTPTNSVVYSAVQGGTWTQPYTYTSSTNNIAGTASISIPANTTVLVLFATSHNYQTTYRFMDTHFYYNLDTVIDGNVICDLRMLETLRTNRNTGNATNSVNIPAYYTQCATQYGDR
jgi:hypothetical protein